MDPPTIDRPDRREDRAAVLQAGDAADTGKERRNGRRNLGPETPKVSPRLWITPSVIRKKNPAVNLSLQYRKVMNISIAASFVLHVVVAVAFPTFEARPVKPRREQTVIQMDDIPETQQIKRPPPPPRPAVPIETESEEVPDDVTIESTELDFDEAPVDLPPPPPPVSHQVEEEVEEIVEFWAVEIKPELVKRVVPEYPEVARKAGLEGVIFVEFTAGKDGRVKNAWVLRGPEIFREAALKSIFQYVFKPALQNDRPISVRMSIPIRFRLTGSD